MKTMSEVCLIENALFVVPAADNGWIPSVCSTGVVKAYKEDLKTNPDGKVMRIELEYGRMVFLARCKEKGRGGGGINHDRWKDCLTRISTTQRGMLYVPAIISKKDTMETLNVHLDDGKETIDGFQVVSGTLGKEILFELEDEGTLAEVLADPEDSTESTDSEQQEDSVVESPSPLLSGEIKAVSDEDLEKLDKSIYDPSQKPTAHLCPTCGTPKKSHEKTSSCFMLDYKNYPIWTCQNCGEVLYCSYDYSKHLDKCRARKKATVSVDGNQIAVAEGGTISIDVIDDIDERFKLAGETVDRIKTNLEKQISNLSLRIDALGPIKEFNSTIAAIGDDQSYEDRIGAIEHHLKKMVILATQNDHTNIAMEALDVVSGGLAKLREKVKES